MRVLTAEDLGVTTWEGVEIPLFTLKSSSHHHRTSSSRLTEQHDAFLRDRFSTKLEDPETGQWISSWREDGI